MTMRKLAIGLGSAIFLMTGALSVGAVLPKIGQPAPDFTAVDIQGKTHKLSEYRGKVVVLEAYNYSCPFVANHYNSGAMQELQAEMAERDVVWLLVNSTHKDHSNYRDPEAAEKEWERLEIAAKAWLHDHDGAVGRLYLMKTTPHMFVIDKEGILVYQGAIDNEPRADSDPREARNYVREAILETLNGQDIEVAQTRPYGCSVKYGPPS
jgi:peroxiredoxin